LNKKKLKIDYISELIKLYPNIISGRKNIEAYKKRIDKNIKLTKNYTKKK